MTLLSILASLSIFCTSGAIFSLANLETVETETGITSYVGNQGLSREIFKMKILPVSCIIFSSSVSTVTGRLSCCGISAFSAPTLEAYLMPVVYADSGREE